MPLWPLLMGEPPAGGYTTGAVNFDGATEGNNAGLVGTNSPFFSIAYWFKIASDQSGSTTWTLNPSVNGAFDFFSSPSEAPALTLRNDNGSGDNIAFSVAGVIPNGVWHSIQASADLNHAAGARPHSLWIDDANVTNDDFDNGAAFSLLVNTIPFVLGSDGFGNFVTCDMADLWWSVGQFIDFSITGNRRKFISAGLNPVDLGGDGGDRDSGHCPFLLLRAMLGCGSAS